MVSFQSLGRTKLVSKLSDLFDEVKFVADPQIGLQPAVNWGKKCLANFYETKMQLLSINNERDPFLLSMADSNPQKRH